MKRYRIAIDLDDTAFDFMNPLLAWHNREYGTALRKEDVLTYHLWVTFGIGREEAIQRVHRFYRTPEFRNLVPMQDANAVIGSLGSRHGIGFVTARSVDLRKPTTALVNRHFGDRPVAFANHYARNNHAIRSKAALCLEAGAEILIDDGGAYAMECAQSGIDAILIDQPWNRDVSGTRITRVRNLTEAEDVAEQLLRDRS